MNILFLSSNRGKICGLNLTKPLHLSLLLVSLALLLGAAGYAGYSLNPGHDRQVLIEQWRRQYNQVRPHSSLGYRPPAPETVEWPRRWSG